MTTARRLVIVMGILAATSAAAAPKRFHTDFAVAGLACTSCAVTATRALEGIPAVVHATVDFASKKARVEATRTIPEEEIRLALAKYGFEARFPRDEVIEPLSEQERALLDIRSASRGGEAFEIRRHLAPGKYTIFDFWADWCGPCHVLTPKLERLVRDRADVALRKIDLQKWDSPAGKQATRQFKVPALPYVRVYDPNGTLVGEVVGNDIDKVKTLLERRRR